MTAPALPDQRRLSIGTFVLLTTYGLSSLISTALTPVLSAMAAHFGGGPQGQLTAQNVITIAAIGTMIGAPISGFLTRWLSTPHVLILGLAIYTIAGSSGVYIDNPTILLTARFIQGMGISAVGITTAAMVADRFEGKARTRFLGYRDAFLAVFGFFALNVSGLVGDAFGWRTNFALYLLAVPYIVLAFIAKFPTPAEPPKAAATDYKILISMWPVYLMVVVLYMVAYTPYLNLSFLLAEDHITSSAIQGRIIAASTVLHFFSSMFYGRVVERIGSRWMLALILLIMAASDLTIGFAPNMYWIIGAMALAGLAGGNLQVYLHNLFLARATPATRGQALGFMIMAMYVGQFLDPYVTTPMRTLVGNHQAFIVVGIGLIAASMLQARFGSAKEAPAT
jgi:MFS family permease